MKPLLFESADNDALLALGRASVQIVHDLKNQLNGLKLYATFLRKRLERDERPSDELETVRKLIAGLDRTAADLSLIVEYGRPLDLNKRSGVDLAKVMREVAAGLNDSPANGNSSGEVVIETESDPMIGEFDSAMLTSALKSISVGALKFATGKQADAPLQIQLKGEAAATSKMGVIEWRGFEGLDHNPFSSLAGSNEIRLGIAARIIEAHGGSANCEDGALRVRLPLTS